MCGILGIISAQIPKSEREANVEKAMSAIRHRGPDGTGIHSSGPASFGHVRLSIIDLEGGKQPFIDKEHLQMLTYNGEIYNYIEIRAELETRGHRFFTQSDTEVVIRAYQEWGSECVKKMNGMFAFAIFDSKNEVAFLARDPFGQKPLYYYSEGQNFAFASELSALRILIPNGEVNISLAARFLVTESWAGSETFEKNFQKLLPGQSLIWDGKRAQVWRYFDLSCKAGAIPSQEQVEQGLESAVRRSLRADVPVAVLLSGGIDSSLVLSQAKKILDSQKISTFTIRNIDASFDESTLAAKTANFFKTDHTEIELSLKDMARIAQEVLPQMDEPIADPGFLPKYHICQKLAKSHKVALTGDGGDEVFFGYEIFKAAWIAGKVEWLPRVLKKNFFTFIAQQIKPSHSYMPIGLKIKRFALGLAEDPMYRNLIWAGSFHTQELFSGLRHPGQAEDAVSEIKKLYRQIFDEEASSNSLTAFSHLYQRTFLPEYVLRNSDRASMKLGIELRAPFLDLDLFQLAQALPEAEKFSNLKTKRILKEIGRDSLPPHLLGQKKKGFTSPVGLLLSGPLKSEFLDAFSEDNCRRTDIFNREFILSMFQRHLDHQDSLFKPLWTSYVLQKWLLQRYGY